MPDTDRDPESDRGRAEGKLYSPGQVAGATFIGTPIAGAWLLAANYRALGAPVLRHKALVVGAVVTVALFVASFFLPEKFPSTIVPLAYTFAIFELAKRQQGDAFRAHIGAGGLKHSWWLAVGVGVAWLVVLMAALLAVAFVLPPDVFPGG